MTHTAISANQFRKKYNLLSKTSLRVASINFIERMQALSDVSATKLWIIVQIVVDSGASETVVGQDALPGTPFEESPDSRRNVCYEVVDGTRVPAMDQKRFVIRTQQGIERSITAQVTNVNKPLLSVSQICGKDHRVVFDKEASYTEDKTIGEVIPMIEKNGTYVIQCWVHNDGGGTELRTSDPGMGLPGPR